MFLDENGVSQDSFERSKKCPQKSQKKTHSCIIVVAICGKTNTGNDGDQSNQFSLGASFIEKNQRKNDCEEGRGGAHNLVERHCNEA